MIKTTVEDLGTAYQNALIDLYRRFDPISPWSLGSLWREHYGLHHKHQSRWFGPHRFWIEFPNDQDYMLFILKWS